MNPSIISLNVSATRLAVALVAACSLLAGTHIASAVVVTWTGTTNGDWTIGGAGGNWNDAAAPAASGDSLVFNTSSNTTITNMPATQSLGGTALLFNVGASAFTIGTGATTVTFTGGGVTNSSTSLQTLNFNIDTGGTNRIFNAATGGGNITVNGAISGGGGISKSNPGTLTLNGANTYTGTTTLSGGTIVLGNDSALGASLLKTSANVTIQASGARSISNDVQILNSSLIIAGSDSLTLSGAVSPSGGSRQISVTNTGGTTLSGSVYLADDNATARILTINNTGNALISGTIANNNFGNTTASALSKTSAGTLTMSGQNIYTGITTVSAGVLAIGADSTPNTANAVLTSGPVGTGMLILSGAGAALQSSGANRTISNPVSFFNNTTIGDGGFDLTLNGLVGINGGNSRTITVNNSGLTTFGGGVMIRLDASLGGRAMTIAGTGNVSIPSVISSGNSNQSDIAYTGSGTATASGDNSYNGLTTVGAGKTLRIGNKDGLGWGGRNLNVTGTTTVASGGVLDLNGQATINEPIIINGTGIGNGGALINSNTGAVATIGNGLALLTTPGAGTGWTTATVNISGGGGATGTATLSGGAITGITITNAGSGYASAPTVTITGDGSAVAAAAVLSSVALASAASIGGAGDINIAAVVSGTALTKVGVGKVTLSGANTYTGGTTLTAGTLQAENPASLGATGSATLNGGTLKLGGSPTLTLNLTSLTWDNTATLSFDLGAANASDTIALSLALNQGVGESGFTFDFNGTGAINSTYTLLTFESTTFTMDSAFNAANKGIDGTFVLGPTSLTFVTVSVPEPSGFALSVIGLLGLLIYFRNRRHRARMPAVGPATGPIRPPGNSHMNSIRPFRMFGFAAIALVHAASTLAAAYVPPANNRVDLNFNYDWKFIKQDVAGAQATAFNDSAWGAVSLPHTWNDDKFREWIFVSNDTKADPLRPSGTYYGKAWYRKHFTIDAAYSGRKVILEFEGIARGATFYINGQNAGLYENGVAPCGVDITPWIVYGGDNVIAVQVNNNDNLNTDPNGPYHGAPIPFTQPYNPNFGGLNRDVTLHICDPLYQTLPLYRNLGTVGTYVYPTNINTLAKTSGLTITAEVKNDYAISKTATLEAVIVDNAGNQVGSTLMASSQAIAAGQKATFAVTTSLTGVHFWSPDYPYLYQVYTILKIGGVAVDVYKTPLGIRKFIFNSTYGLQINGHPIYLDGYAPRTSMEWPCVGMPVDWMNEYDFKLMKDNNANFVRPMHIGPPRVQVNAADKFGLVMTVPAANNEGDDTDPDVWQQRLDIMRDVTVYYRNNPSVLFYEGCNQVMSAQHMQDMLNIRLAWDPYGGRLAGTRSNDPDITYGIREYSCTMDINGTQIATPLWDAEYARGESPRRVWDNYTPMLNPRWDGVNTSTAPVAGTVGDTTHRYLLGGYFYIASNYHQSVGLNSGTGDYIGDYLTSITPAGGGTKFHPYFRLQNSEDMVIENLAKYYGRYMRSVFVQPQAISAANGVMVGGAKIIWSDSVTDGRMHDTEVTRVSGAVDGARLPKETFYGLKVAHADPVTQPQVYIVGHWNYAAGTVKRVYVVSNTAQVKLQTFNAAGTLITDYGFGVKNFFPTDVFGASSDQQNNYVFAFDNVAWLPGSIKAFGYNNGSQTPVATHTKTTAGAPAALRITSIVGPSGQWRADGSDIAMFDVEVIDAAGNRCPTWEDSVTFSCTGQGTFLGGYNSGKRYSTNLANLTSGYSLNLDAGINRVFVRATRTAGSFTLTATKSGLTTANSTISSTAFTVTNGLTATVPQSYTVPLGTEPAPVAEGTAPPPPPNAPNPAPDTDIVNMHYSGGHADEATIVQNAKPGALVYMDSSTIALPSNLPGYLIGGEFIRPFKGDAGETSSTDQYQFDITRFAYMYQLIDSANGMPNHNNNSTYQWTLLPETVTINGRSMKIYKSRLMQPYENGYFAANGHENAAPGFNTSSNMYLVFVVNAEQELQLPTNVISATSTQSTNTASKAIDADVSTRWNASSSAMPQVVDLDLGRNVLIGGYEINWQSADTKSYQYKVEVSANGTTYDTSLDMTGNVNLGADEYRVPAVGAFACRYVRITVTAASGGGWAAINELKVRGVLNAAPTAVPVITSALTASGNGGYAFNYTITASSSPTGFAAQGLPNGFSLNGNTGVISGITLQSGVIPITISGISTGGTGSAILNLTMAAPPPIPVINSALTYSTLAGVAIPSASAYQITATNLNFTPVSYGASLPSGLGLTISASTGKIAGTPKYPGTYAIPITATNPGGTSNPATLQFTVTPNGAAPVISSAGTASGTVGAAFSYQIAGSGTPTLFGASGLPPGLSVSTSTGLISGTPTTAGPYNATVTATNAGGAGSKSVTITIAVNPNAPVITSALTASGNTGTAFSYSIVATNTPTSYSAMTLPAGLVVNVTTGVISGTPTTVGTSNVTIKATNASGFDSKTLVITVTAPAAPPVVTSPANAVGSIGASFSYQITATSSPTGFTASPLPAGLGVSASTGLISGTPTAAGTTTVTLGATNADGTGNKTLTIVISASGADINLALNRPVFASSEHTTGNTAGKAVDGDSATRWESDYSDPQWIYVDLGSSKTIHSIVLNWQNAAGKNYSLQGSTDANTWTDLVPPIVGNTQSGVFTFNTTGNPTARYVRMYGTVRKTTFGYSPFEFQVMGPATGGGTTPPSITSPLTASGTVGAPFSYTITATNSPTSYSASPLPANLSFNTATGVISGTPTTAGTTNVNISASNAGGSDPETLVITIGSGGGDTNIAQGVTAVVASSSQTGNDAVKGNDGSLTTRWAASGASFPQTWTIDFGASRTLSRADIAWYSSASRYYQYKIETSLDDATYALKADKTANTAFGDTSDAFSATARYVKITVTSASAGFASAYEFKIYGH